MLSLLCMHGDRSDLALSSILYTYLTCSAGLGVLVPVTHQKCRVPELNDILALLERVPETIEILPVPGADRRSFSDDCDLGVYTSRYAHPPPILGWKSIPGNSPACPNAVSFWVFMSFWYGLFHFGPLRESFFLFLFCGVCWRF